MKIAIGQAGTPEWHLCAFAGEAAAAAGIALERKRFDGGEARRVASVHEGMADVSVALAETVRWTYRAQGAYDGWRHTSLRALAAIHHAQWLGVAARWEAGIGSLADLGAARDLRLSAPLPGGESATWAFAAGQALAAHGVRVGELAERGWRVEDLAKGAARVRSLDFDVLIAPLGPVGSTHASLWQEASVLANLRFLPLSDAALERIHSDHGLPRATLPAGTLRGVDAPVPTVGFQRWTVFVSERLEDRVALALARALEERRAALVPLHAALDPLCSLEDLGLPVHRAVKRDREERGLAAWRTPGREERQA
ncbi:MAG: hypothetical protein IT529_11935 [Burkholderiales bacterium]|nr:hypothetical protein [Burkholderiales bacterium]